MIVYGDGQRREETARLLAELEEGCCALCEPAATASHDLATRLLIEAGELAQGLLDAACEARGRDDWCEVEEHCSRLTLEAARLALGAGEPAAFVRTLSRLSRLTLPEAVTVRVPEGYAFYALYPEQYALAARRLRASHGGPVVVVGLRSIGTSLAAVVAAACGTSLLPVTLRPVGHPFRRTLRLGPRLERLLLDQPADALYAIVDEGPGLSGSSFGAVADWLEERGVSPHRIHFFPGHGGDLGPHADARHRSRWQHAARHVIPFESLSIVGPGEDVGGGRWRELHYPDEASWPPANPTQERRKYLFREDGRTWIAKFAGLGRHGEAKLQRGRRLERAGFVPPLRGLRRGFLVQEWLRARPLPLAASVDREALVGGVAEYLAALADEAPARTAPAGASPEQLLHMTRVNAEERFGPEAASALDRWVEHLDTLPGRLRPVATDNRMHAWEWLLLPDGRFLKADALDHHQAHDCIGPQDLAWDVVGATVELSLTEAERFRLEDRLARLSAYRPDPLVSGFYRPCYLAFQMGYYEMAAASLPSWPAEAGRLRSAADRYAQMLGGVLAEGVP